jgi:hypothetical protein
MLRTLIGRWRSLPAIVIVGLGLAGAWAAFWTARTREWNVARRDFEYLATDRI